MKERDKADQQQHGAPTVTPLENEDGKGGKVSPGAIIPEDNSLEKSGDGDRTDTEEMHRLNEEGRN